MYKLDEFNNVVEERVVRKREVLSMSDVVSMLNRYTVVTVCAEIVDIGRVCRGAYGTSIPYTLHLIHDHRLLKESVTIHKNVDTDQGMFLSGKSIGDIVTLRLCSNGRDYYYEVLTDE